jgi:hypothetical protein
VLFIVVLLEIIWPTIHVPKVGVAVVEQSPAVLVEAITNKPAVLDVDASITHNASPSKASCALFEVPAPVTTM